MYFYTENESPWAIHGEDFVILAYVVFTQCQRVTRGRVRAPVARLAPRVRWADLLIARLAPRLRLADRQTDTTYQPDSQPFCQYSAVSWELTDGQTDGQPDRS